MSPFSFTGVAAGGPSFDKRRSKIRVPLSDHSYSARLAQKGDRETTAFLAAWRAADLPVPESSDALAAAVRAAAAPFTSRGFPPPVRASAQRLLKLAERTERADREAQKGGRR